MIVFKKVVEKSFFFFFSHVVPLFFLSRILRMRTKLQQTRSNGSNCHPSRLLLKSQRLPLLPRRTKRPSPRRLPPLPLSQSLSTLLPRARRRTCPSLWLLLTTPRPSRLHGTTGGRRRNSSSPSSLLTARSRRRVSLSSLPHHQTSLEAFTLDTPWPSLSRMVLLAGKQGWSHGLFLDSSGAHCFNTC